MKLKFKRKCYFKVKEAIKNKQTAVLFGLRRLGKTTILKQLFSENPNSFYLDWSNYANKTQTDLDFYNYLESLAQKYDLLLFDEVQERASWDEMLFSLWNKFVYSNQCRIVFTGSSSLLIKPRELGLNRSKRIYINTLSFSEYCEMTFKKPTNEVFEYFLGRGFPDFVEWDFQKKGFAEPETQVLSPIFTEDLYREFPKLKTSNLILLLEYLGKYVFGEVNESNISRELMIDRKAIREYISIFERANILKRIYKVDENGKQSRKRSYKIYLNPHMYIWINKMEFSKIKKLYPNKVGHIIEAFWIHYKLEGYNVFSPYYYMKHSRYKNKEIDFVKLDGIKNTFSEIHEIKYKNKLTLSDSTNLHIIDSDHKFIWNKNNNSDNVSIEIKSLLEI